MFWRRASSFFEIVAAVRRVRAVAGAGVAVRGGVVPAGDGKRRSALKSAISIVSTSGIGRWVRVFMSGSFRS